MTHRIYDPAEGRWRDARPIGWLFHTGPGGRLNPTDQPDTDDTEEHAA